MKKSPSSLSDAVQQIRTRMSDIHTSQVNGSLAWKRHQLKCLLKMLQNEKDSICQALYLDLHKSELEANISEIQLAIAEIKYLLKRIGQVHQRSKAVASPMLLLPGRTRVMQYLPLAPPGVLILGPMNYPFLLVLRPAAGSLAVGNPTLIKPSEQCPATTQLLQELIPKYFGSENDDASMRENGVASTTSCGLFVAPGNMGGQQTQQLLLSQQWAKVCFTGSPRVGKLVASACAQTLTPCLLELGGKSPVIIDGRTILSNRNDLRQIADRIVFGKLINAGQSCVAPDYIVVVTDKDEGLSQQLAQELQKAVARQYGSNPQTDSSMGRVINTAAAQRHESMIRNMEQQHSTLVVCGGSRACDVADKYIAPTVSLDPPSDCTVWKEEIFGPILPIKTVSSNQEAVEFCRATSPAHPLALYVFTKSARTFELFRRAIPAGGVMRNECLLHLSNHRIPFGGIGNSGYGNYHGDYSLQTFSRVQPVSYRPLLPGSDFGMLRFQPTGPRKSALLEQLMQLPYVPIVARPTTLTALGALLAFALTKYVPQARRLWQSTLVPVLVAAVQWMAEWLQQQQQQE